MTLPRSFFHRPTLEVARDLIGVRVVHEVRGARAGGIIVETEAYIGEDDPACHAAAGLTARTALMYGPPGVAYVYLNYGIHFLLTAVTEGEGRPAAVLIRALAPEEGLAVMRRRRGMDASLPDAALCRGPGNLTRALGISLTQNGADLCGGSRLTFEAAAGAPGPLAWGPRVGINVGTDAPWRCWVAGHPAVSGPRPLRAARATRRVTPPSYAAAPAAAPPARGYRAARRRG
jgi:DNA-3-methyladenine glycosylase